MHLKKGLPASGGENALTVVKRSTKVILPLACGRALLMRLPLLPVLPEPPAPAERSRRSTSTAGEGPGFRVIRGGLVTLAPGPFLH